MCRQSTVATIDRIDTEQTLSSPKTYETCANQGDSRGVLVMCDLLKFKYGFKQAPAQKPGLRLYKRDLWTNGNNVSDSTLFYLEFAITQP